MSQENVKLIQDAYAAFARGDGPSVLGAMDPTIVWNEAENFPYADRNPYSGPAAVAEGIFFRYANDWENFHVSPAQFFDAGDTVIVTGRYTGTYKASKKSLDAQFAHVWHITNGKVSTFQQYTDTAQAQRVVNTHIEPGGLQLETAIVANTVLLRPPQMRVLRLKPSVGRGGGSSTPSSTQQKRVFHPSRSLRG